jgi:uncharacterized membrane protein YqiK
MGLALGLMLVFALALIAGPIALTILGRDIGAMSSTIMLGSGIVLAVTCSIILTITKLYVKTKASEAFVRTGLGGLKVIRDGGALVIPVVHQVVRVSLETIKLNVIREGAEALITSDKLRADIRGEFFIRVQPVNDDIQAAARSLGDKMTAETRRDGRGNSQSVVAEIVEDKLVSALRTAAARKTLEQLNSERDEFLKEVITQISADLKHNGFMLETVTISKLDQTDVANLKAENIFDAQGMRAIAEITQDNLTKKNAIVRAGEQARMNQDVTTRKAVLELGRSQAEAEATQASQIAVIQAEQARASKEKTILADQAVAVAKVDQTKAIEVATRQQQAAIETADRQKQQTIVEAEQKLEVAKRQQQKAIADSDTLKAGAEQKQAEAEADRQKARAAVITVEQIAQAEREKDIAVIAATAEAQKSYVTAQKSADASAYKVQKEAEARKAAADAEAEATMKQAKASSDAKKLAAEAEQAQLEAQAAGQKAKDMVPVEVNARQVEVNRQQIETVLKPELQARDEFGKSAQEFELARFRIEKEATVRIAAAGAMATVYNKITANVFGTPEDAAKMGQKFADGFGLSQVLNGLMSDPTMAVAVKSAASTVEALTTAAADKLKK